MLDFQKNYGIIILSARQRGDDGIGSHDAPKLHW